MNQKNQPLLTYFVVIVALSITSVHTTLPIFGLSKLQNISNGMLVGGLAGYVTWHLLHDPVAKDLRKTNTILRSIESIPKDTEWMFRQNFFLYGFSVEDQAVFSDHGQYDLAQQYEFFRTYLKKASPESQWYDRQSKQTILLLPKLKDDLDLNWKKLYFSHIIVVVCSIAVGIRVKKIIQTLFPQVV